MTNVNRIYSASRCFGSIFIESGSGFSQKSQSGSGSKLFLTTIWIFLKLFNNYKIFSSKKVNWMTGLFLSPWIRIQKTPESGSNLDPDPKHCRVPNKRCKKLQEPNNKKTFQNEKNMKHWKYAEKCYKRFMLENNINRLYLPYYFDFLINHKIYCNF